MSAASVIPALFRAAADLPSPPLRRVLLASLGWTVLGFVLLWTGMGWGLEHLLSRYAFFHATGVAAVSAVLGAFAVPILTFMLFPVVATTILGFYVDGVIESVETRHYPDVILYPPPSLGVQARALLSLALVGLGLNLLALPFYLLVPGANLILFVVLNGYLLGRGNYELVALRRSTWIGARQHWRHRRLDFLLLGAALTGIFTIPIVNLLAPLIGAAAAVHLFEQARPQGLADMSESPKGV